jgi:hypothetical protein
MTVWTATEIADAIGVNPKAFRSFVRSTVRSNGGKVGEQTPGSGGRYAFDDDGIDADAFIASWSAAYRAHARTNNTRTVTLASLGVPMVDDAPEDDAADA